MKVICPLCNTEIEVPTYYSRHRQKLLQQYQQNKNNPDFVKRRREIALKCYHKKKDQL